MQAPPKACVVFTALPPLLQCPQISTRTLWACAWTREALSDALQLPLADNLRRGAVQTGACVLVMPLLQSAGNGLRRTVRDSDVLPGLVQTTLVAIHLAQGWGKKGLQRSGSGQFLAKVTNLNEW